jgi:hypothetical protein
VQREWIEHGVVSEKSGLVKLLQGL